MATGWQARSLAISAFAIVLVIGVLSRPPLPIDETRYLTVAWEMYLGGDFRILHLNGEIYTQKPPLLFWLINLVWSLTGVSETAARLVGPAFAVGCLVLIAPLARSLWPERKGIESRSTVIMAGFAVFGVFGGLTFFDAMLAFATILGIWSLVLAIRRRRWQGWLGFGLATAFGVYAKGPVILIHLLPLVLFYRFWLKGDQPPHIRYVASGLIGSMLISLLLVALWLVPALSTGGEDFRTAVLWTQSAGRITASFAHERQFWFYIAVLPALLYPWFWVPATWSSLRRISLHDADRGLRLCIVWAVAPLVLFSAISGKQIHYLIPELPATALLLARILPEKLGERQWRAAGIPVGLIALAALVAPSGLVDTGELQPLLKPPTTFIAAGLFLLALIATISRLPAFTGIAVVGLGLVLLQSLLIGFSVIGEAYNTKPIATRVAGYDGHGIAVYHIKYNGEFGFTGRLRHPVDHLTSEQELKGWVCRHPDGIVFARQDRAHPDWQWQDEFRYRNRPHALWIIANRTPSACAT